MGGKQSNLNRTDSDASSTGECEPCFLFRSPFRSNDPIGSPMPETPVHHRQKRNQAIKNALRGDQKNSPAFSSKYIGLEKEVDYRSKSSLEDQENECRAEVHEGKVSTFLSFVLSLVLHRANYCFTLSPRLSTMISAMIRTRLLLYFNISRMLKFNYMQSIN